MNKYAKIAVNGLVRENATFRLVLGTCATLGLTTSALAGLGMGLSVTLVLILSNTIISLLRKAIPQSVRIPSYIVIIATMVTILRMLLDKFLPDLYDVMGVYLPLIVVNCIILGRAESFASKRPVSESAADGLFTGLGYTLGITFIGIVRELLGSGTLFGLRIMDFTIGFFTNAAGAFFVYGVCIALFSLCVDTFDRSRRIKNAKTLMIPQGDAPLEAPKEEVS